MNDPFFDTEEDKKEDDEEKEKLDKPVIPSSPSLGLPKIEVENPTPEPIVEPIEKPKEKLIDIYEEKPKMKSKGKKEVKYTPRQKIVAVVLYWSIVISCLITIGGSIWFISDIIMRRGKTDYFLSLSLGWQMAIIGAWLAGFFFLMIFFYALFRKGVKTIAKILFSDRELEDKYKDQLIVKIGAGALMVSVFAIILGIIIALIYELLMGATGGTSSLSTLLESYSGGQIALSFGIMLLILNALAFALNYLWYNGYHLILRMITDLEEK